MTHSGVTCVLCLPTPRGRCGWADGARLVTVAGAPELRCYVQQRPGWPPFALVADVAMLFSAAT